MRTNYRVNTKVETTSKLLIGLGDSFIEGQGALPLDIWDKYNWSKDKLQADYHNNFNEYYDIELQNSILSIITKEYLTDYTPINLGFRGRGLRNATKNLTCLNLDLELTKAKELIVLVAATQFSRFDFLRGHNYNSHHQFFTVWPAQPDSKNHTPGEVRLWEGYATDVHNDTTEIIEFLFNIQEIKNWCKLYNARLILTSACEPRFYKEYFNSILIDEQNSRKESVEDYTNLECLRNIIDWENDVWRPGGHNAFTDLLSEYEEKPEFIGNENWFPWAENRKVGKGYFTPCSHPSIKGHQILAEHFYKENF